MWNYNESKTFSISKHVSAYETCFDFFFICLCNSSIQNNKLKPIQYLVIDPCTVLHVQLSFSAFFRTESAALVFLIPRASPHSLHNPRPSAPTSSPPTPDSTVRGI